MQHIAKKLSFPSTRSFMESHLVPLFRRWIGELKLSLGAFPIYLLDCADLHDFLLRYTGVLLPQLVFLRHKDSLDVIAKILNVKPKDLIK